MSYFSLINSMNRILPVSYGALTSAWITATSESNTTILNALNNLEIAGNSNGWLTKMSILYPFVGGNSAKHALNFINPATYALSFASGVTHDSLGITGNGTTGYADTGFPNNTTGQNDTSIGVYIQIAVGQGYFGSIGGSSRSYIFGLGSLYMTVNSGLDSIVDSTAGFKGITRTSSGSRTIVNDTTTYTASTASATASSLNQFILATNLTGSAYGFTTETISLAFQGSGLTITELEDMRTDVVAFQTALSRNV